MKNQQYLQQNLRFQIHLALRRKYDLSVNKFWTKQIGQIYMSTKRSKPNLTCKEVVILSDDHQWMRKMYGKVDNDQSQEVLDRISLLTSHYASQKNQMGSQYPTMFVTQTEKIFLTRHRKKKIHMSSENEKNSISSQDQSKFSNFLQVFDSSQLSCNSSNSEWTFLNITNSFSCKSKQYTLYNIFSVKQNMNESKESSSMQVSEPEVIDFNEKVDHLIYDFQQVNEEQLLHKIKNSHEKFKEKIRAQLFKVGNKDLKSFFFDDDQGQLMYQKTYDEQIVDQKMSKKRSNYIFEAKRENEQDSSSVRGKASRLLTRIQNTSQYFHKSTFLSSFN